MYPLPSPLVSNIYLDFRRHGRDSRVWKLSWAPSPQSSEEGAQGSLETRSDDHDDENLGKLYILIIMLHIVGHYCYNK